MGPVGAVALLTPEIIKGLKYLKGLGVAGKVAKYGKAAYASKHFLPTALGAGYLGSEGLTYLGQKGERELTKEQLKLQNLVAKASAEANKKAVVESQKRTKEYMTMLIKAQKEQQKEARDLAAIESFTESQNRQMGMIVQAIQSLSGRQMGASTSAPQGSGMLNLMRGGF